MKLPHFLSDPTSAVTRATAPAAEGDAVPTDAGSILSIALDVGTEILRTGGEIHRVEDTLTRICRAYGAEEVQAFSIPSLVAATIRMNFWRAMLSALLGVMIAGAVVTLICLGVSSGIEWLGFLI